MSSLRERKAALKRKRSPRPARDRSSGAAGADDEDDAMIAALEKKLGGRKKKASRATMDGELAEDGFGDGFLEYLDRIDPAPAPAADEAPEEAEAEAAVADADGTTAFYAPTEGTDLYGRSTTGGGGGAWKPRRLRVDADGTPPALDEALTGALNRVADGTVGATASAIAAAYAAFPAARVNARIVDACESACLHAKQAMAATLIPPFAAAVAAAHFSERRDLGASLLERVAPALAAGLEDGGRRAENAAALVAALCDVGLVGPALPRTSLGPVSTSTSR